jgi:penicillin-binding protein 1A
MVRSTIRAIACVLVCSVGAPVAVLTTVIAAFVLLPLPATLPEAKAVQGSIVSRVLDKDGNEIAVFREFEQNLPVQAQDIPLVLKQAVVASEDRNFYHHGGVDLRGSARALVADLRNSGFVQGGSTITQQYVKNAYTGKQRTLVRKVRELVLASQLDRRTPKDQILFKYLGSIYLGEGAYGVGAASATYFRHPVNNLSLSEAALLAGIIPAPSRYEPRGNPQAAESRRETVLGKMLQQHYINDQQYASALQQRIVSSANAKPGVPLTAVFPPLQEPTKYPYFVDYVRRYLIARYGPARVFRGGLTIQTTLDPALQELADRTVRESLSGTSTPLEMSMVAVEPPTGYVKAVVGGRDFNRSQVNLALGGCPTRPQKAKVEVEATCWGGETVTGGGTGRQPGSAFKPFTLATALSKGFSPSRVYAAPNAYTVPNCHGDHCTIGNNEGEGGGSVTLRVATWKSINTVFAQLIRDVGVRDTAEMAKRMGITSAWESPAVHGLSYTLGPLDVSPLDMASAYGVFANHGARQEPTPVAIVRDATGKVLEDNLHRADGVRVIDPVVASNVTDMLRGVLTQGTATGKDIGRPAAGKTGTAENFSNAWFVGYTPTLSTSVWLGYTGSQTEPLRHIHGVDKVYGGTIPAQTWHNFMVEALKDVPVTDFEQPAPVKPLAEAVDRAARGGIDPGNRRYPIDTDNGGSYFQGLPRPVATPPSTSTTAPPFEPQPTAPPPTTTTILPRRP